MIRNGLSCGLLVTATLLPTLAAAQQAGSTRPQSPQFSYNYVELAYDETDFKIGGNEIDGDSLTLSGSFEIGQDWHAYVSYGSADLDFGIDIDSWAIGAGYALPLKQDIDLYGRVLYINSDVDFPGPGDDDDDGLGLQLRIRARVANNIEVEGGIQHVNVGDSDTSLQIGARYHFTNALSAGIGLTFGGDADGLGINARFSF
jgi:hypothetical protein